MLHENYSSLKNPLHKMEGAANDNDNHKVKLTGKNLFLSLNSIPIITNV